MSDSKPVIFNDIDKCIDSIIDNLGKKIILGMPLALGKSYHLVNAIYERAKKDPQMDLTFISALALEKPGWNSDLERRMMQPVIERIWQGVPDFEYMKDIRKNTLPPNVTIREFFCKAGGYVGVTHAQREYTSSNYTHVVRDIILSGINVYMHTVAKKDINGEIFYSDSCNADMGTDLIDQMELKQKEGVKSLHVGHVNTSLPFMFGDAVISENRYDMIFEGKNADFPLFSVPKQSVGIPEYMIGLYVSSLIKDGGTLQIGIGALGDAIADCLIMRHKNNEKYKDVLEISGIRNRYTDLINNTGGDSPFNEGLYGATEMLVEVFMELYRAGIVKRKVYDNISVQKLVNEKILTENLTSDGVEKLLGEEPFFPVLTEKYFNILQGFGIFKENLSFNNDTILNGSNSWSSDLRDSENRASIIKNCIGNKLKKGVILHGGFFIGSNAFYDELRNMSDDERRQFEMSGVQKINQLYGGEELRALQRKHARFANTGMFLSLLGNICSDGLDNGTVISGVGGQYNFVSMAHALPDARLIMMIKSTKTKGKKTLSNIVFNYGHTTVPRHLRDIVVTEYGIADLRGKTDQDVIKEILNITDSRFQNELLIKAKDAGKICDNYEIPFEYKNNSPEKIADILSNFQKENYFKPFPFGSEFTDEEIIIGKALKTFKSSIEINKLSTLKKLGKQMFSPPPTSAERYLKRLKLEEPASIKEKILQKVVVHALEDSGAI